MTNKINGIDVSECPLFDKNTGCYHTFNGECVKDSCAVYKWLLEYKRLQEENEELKNRLKTLDDEEFVYEVSEIEYNNFKKMNDYKQALEEIKNSAELEAMLDKNSKVFYSANIQRILDKINEVLNEKP